VLAFAPRRRRKAHFLIDFRVEADFLLKPRKSLTDRGEQLIVA
jgi:hypothetical protein